MHEAHRFLHETPKMIGTGLYMTIRINPVRRFPACETKLLLDVSDVTGLNIDAIFVPNVLTLKSVSRHTRLLR